MQRKEQDWKTSQQFDFTPFDDRSFVTCVLGKTLSLFRDRRGGGGTSGGSSDEVHIAGYQSTHYDLEYVKDQVTHKRIKGHGSEWRVVEESALVFRFDGLDYITSVFDVYDLPSNISQLGSLQQLNRWVHDNADEAPTAYVVQGQQMPAAKFPFYWHRSISHGGNYKLRWTKVARECGVELTLNKMSEILVAFQTHCVNRNSYGG